MTDLKPCPVPWCESTDTIIVSDPTDPQTPYYGFCNACTTLDGVIHDEYPENDNAKD